ncbi:MAG: GC-type dockerin domain-anchored protein [Phycisphaerales bacterium JB060]
MRPNIIASLGACLLLSPVALGQDVLFNNTLSFESYPIGNALTDLGIDATYTQTSEQTLDALRSQHWDMVIIRRYFVFDAATRPDVLAELEAHVTRGGRLHVQIADLEHAPDGWYDLLGLEGAVDLELPLDHIYVPTPAHPIWNTGGAGGFFRLADERFPPDYGDSLILGASAFAVGQFGVDGESAIAIAREGRVVVNGQQWDNWESGAGVAANQISWLLSCPADLDGDGELSVFDFLEFQNLFAAGDPRADFCYDRTLDIFDFLAFFNQFEVGCR